MHLKSTLTNQTQTLKNGNLESRRHFLVDLLERCMPVAGNSLGIYSRSSYTMAGIESRTSPYAASYSGENNQQYALYGNNGSGQLYHNGSATSFDGFVSGDVIGVALDMDAGNLYFYKNGSAMNSGNAAGVNVIYTNRCVDSKLPRSGRGAYNDALF